MVEGGLFIVFEGIDGAGKGTQRTELASYLRGLGQAVHLTQEPSPGPCGAILRRALKREMAFDEETMALLFAADRRDHLRSLGAHFEKGDIVLCDRHLLSSLAYNGERDAGPWLLTINGPSIQMRRPDLTILLDLDPATALARVDERGMRRERYEHEEKLQPVRERYLYWIEKLEIPHLILDANQPPEVLQEAIRRRVMTLLRERGALK